MIVCVYACVFRKKDRCMRTYMLPCEPNPLNDAFHVLTCNFATNALNSVHHRHHARHASVARGVRVYDVPIGSLCARVNIACVVFATAAARSNDRVISLVVCILLAVAVDGVDVGSGQGSGEYC